MPLYRAEVSNVTSILTLTVHTLGHCAICGMYRTLGFRDEETEWDICYGCLEHAIEADRELSAELYGLRRPTKTESFPDG